MDEQLFAKPIVKDQYWVVTNGKDKVGNVIAEKDGYEVKLNGVSIKYEDISSIKQNTAINFVSISTANTEPNKVKIQNTVRGVKTYNNMFDVKRKLHLYTKTLDSKCYYVSGYFNVMINGVWETIDCPKYIYIQRYSYYGPFETEKQAVENFRTIQSSYD